MFSLCFPFAFNDKNVLRKLKCSVNIHREQSHKSSKARFLSTLKLPFPSPVLLHYLSCVGFMLFCTNQRNIFNNQPGNLFSYQSVWFLALPRGECKLFCAYRCKSSVVQNSSAGDISLQHNGQLKLLSKSSIIKKLPLKYSSKINDLSK